MSMINKEQRESIKTIALSLLIGLMFGAFAMNNYMDKQAHKLEMRAKNIAATSKQ